MTGAPGEDAGKGGEVLSLELPIRTVSLTNARTHWAVKAKRAKAEREQVKWNWLLLNGRKIGQAETVGVWLCRIAPRRLDSDNLTSALKHVRDQIAAMLGVDDGTERVVWMYEQRKGKPREYAVLVEVRYSPRLGMLKAGQ